MPLIMRPLAPFCVDSTRYARYVEDVAKAIATSKRQGKTEVDSWKDEFGFRRWRSMVDQGGHRP